MTESDSDTVSLYALNSEQFPEEKLAPQRTRSGRTTKHNEDAVTEYLSVPTRAAILSDPFINVP